MKKILAFALVLSFAQCLFAQNMQIYTTTMGKIDIQLSKIDSITFSGVGGFQVSPKDISINVGGSVNATISGGITPYGFQSGPNTSIATASISGSTLTVNGVGNGTTSLVVKDNSVPALTANVSIAVGLGPGGLYANPNYLSILVGSQQTSTISGGTTPYSIQTSPNASIATASISGSTLTVHGVGNGSTYLIVKDNSTPYNTVVVNIYVKQPFSTPGSLSFSSTAGNFSANGIFDNVSDSMPTNTQGAGGGYSKQPGSSANLTVIGYVKNSSTNWDIVAVFLSDTGSLTSGSYPFTVTGGLSRSAEFMYIKGWNPSDTSGSDPFSGAEYMLSTGSVSLSSFTGSSAQGTFSGTGAWYSALGVPDPTRLITLTSGTFNVPVISDAFKTDSDTPQRQKIVGTLNSRLH